MRTEIPQENGWYWMATPHSAKQHMAQVFCDSGGKKMVMVMSDSNPTSFTVYYHEEHLDGHIFTKIHRPR